MDEVTPVLREIIAARCLHERRSPVNVWAVAPETERDDEIREYERTEGLAEHSVTRTTESEGAKLMFYRHNRHGYPVLTTTSRNAFARGIPGHKGMSEKTLRTLQSDYG